MTDTPFELDGIEPIRLIGRGGFGEVWLARQTSIDRQVAVKIGFAPLDDRTAQLRFERECVALGRLSGHPNIIEVFTAGLLANGRPYLVLEYVDGGTLWQRVQKGPLTEAELRRVGSELAEALEVAHAAGILHRDLKPENVLLRTNGEAVLGDFGIARVNDTTNTGATGITASVAYAAPEILSGKEATAASDLYGLGVCLLSGALQAVPFVERTDESVHPIINRVLSDKPPDLRAKGLSKQLGSLISSLLKKDPSKRPSTATEVKRAFQSLPPLGPQGSDDTNPMPTPMDAPKANGAGGGPGTGSADSGSPTWDRVRLAGGAFGATLLVGGLGLFGLSQLDDDGVTTAGTTTTSPPTTLETDTAEQSEGVSDGTAISSDPGDETTTTASLEPLVLPLELGDTPLDAASTIAPDQSGPGSIQFCDAAPATDGLVEWEGETLADPIGYPLVFQQVARFDSPEAASDYIESYLGTVRCDRWTIDGDGDGPGIVLQPEVAEAAETFGDQTSEVRFTGESGEVELFGRVALVQSEGDVLTVSVTSLDDDDLDLLDGLVEVAVERLGY